MDSRWEFSQRIIAQNIAYTTIGKSRPFLKIGIHRTFVPVIWRRRIVFTENRYFFEHPGRTSDRECQTESDPVLGSADHEELRNAPDLIDDKKT